MQNRQRANWVLIAVFVGAISLPLIVQLIGAKNQQHQPPPLPATAKALWDFPDKFTKYYGDNFGLRADLIHLHAVAMYRGLGMLPSDKVLAGREGWLYYADDYSLEDFHSFQPFSQTEMEKWRSVMEERQAWLARHGAKLLIVFACDKYVIYPEFLPEGVRRADGPYRVDQLADYLQKNSSLAVVTLHPSLDAAKARDRLYHKTDTHWNDRGAYVGYVDILQALQIEPQPMSSFQRIEQPTAGWDLAKMIGVSAMTREENEALEPVRPRRARVVQQDRPDALWNNGRVTLEVDDSSLPRLVMFRDSFGSALVPLLAEHFRRSVFLWQYDFDPHVVEQEKPDIVVWLMTSRRLQWFDPINPPLP